MRAFRAAVSRAALAFAVARALLPPLRRWELSRSLLAEDAVAAACSLSPGELPLLELTDMRRWVRIRLEEAFELMDGRRSDRTPRSMSSVEFEDDG